MRRSFNAILMVLVATTAVAATSPRRRATVSRGNPAWTVGIVSDGGFAGVGAGSVSVSADGMMIVTPPGAKARACRYQLGASDLRAFDDLVAKANARAWVDSYAPASNPTGCCDMIRRTLTMTRRENLNAATYSTHWFDAHEPMPDDLVAIADALFSSDPASLRSRFLPLCTNTP